MGTSVREVMQDMYLSVAAEESGHAANALPFIHQGPALYGRMWQF